MDDLISIDVLKFQDIDNINMVVIMKWIEHINSKYKKNENRVNISFNESIDLGITIDSKEWGFLRTLIRKVKWETFVMRRDLFQKDPYISFLPEVKFDFFQ